MSDEPIVVLVINGEFWAVVGWDESRNIHREDTVVSLWRLRDGDDWPLGHVVQTYMSGDGAEDPFGPRALVKYENASVRLEHFKWLAKVKRLRGDAAPAVKLMLAWNEGDGSGWRHEELDVKRGVVRGEGEGEWR